MTPELLAVENPDPAEQDAVFGALRAFNLEKTQFSGPIGTFAVLIRDETGNTIGGVWTRLAYDWLFVSLLYVPEHLRGSGMGRDLMQRVEAYARARNCIGIHLDTFSFQAPGFYEKLGFEEMGVLENYPGSFSRHFYLKRLRKQGPDSKPSGT